MKNEDKETPHLKYWGKIKKKVRKRWEEERVTEQAEYGKKNWEMGKKQEKRRGHMTLKICERKLKNGVKADDELQKESLKR